MPFSDPWSSHHRAEPSSLIPPVPLASQYPQHQNSLAGSELLKSNSLLFYPLISLDGSVSSSALQKGSRLPHCEISTASPKRELCRETRFSRLREKPFPCFPMNLLNAGDSANALSQACWQEDCSHLPPPLGQRQVRAARPWGAAAQGLVAARAEAARGVCGEDRAGPYAGSTGFTCLWDCGVRHWSRAATAG